MEAKDMLLAPEPIPFRDFGEKEFLAIAATGDGLGPGRFNLVCIQPGGEVKKYSNDWMQKNPALQAFIDKARQHFTPKRSCGELTREDFDVLTQLWGSEIFKPHVTETDRERIINEWAGARGIQLPEAP